MCRYFELRVSSAVEPQRQQMILFRAAPISLPLLSCLLLNASDLEKCVLVCFDQPVPKLKR